jgi:hypothetical protein
VEDNVNDSDDWAMAQLDPTEEPRQVRVLDLIDPNVPRANSETRQHRMSVCHSCPELKLGTICGQCNCVMKFKTWLDPATCPLGKW